MTGPDRARELADRVRTGGLVLLLDDAIDPPEAVLVGAAARATPEAVNFMVTHGRGLVCLGLTRERMRRLGIPLMASEQSARLPAYGASIEARRGVSTGISASDRATTILAAVAPESTSADLVMPGHITPIQIVSGGSLVRAGLPEAASDLVRLAGLGFEAVLCEVLGRDGNLASGEELVALARDHHVPAVTVTDVIHMRLRSDTLVRRRAEAALPVQDGATFRAIVYDNSIDQQQHMALVLGELRGGAEVLVRLHSECLTGDVFGSQRCDCGEQLSQAMQPSPRPGRACSSTCTRKAAGSAWPTSCARTPCRTAAATRSRRTSSSASARTSATTASEPRFCATSASSASVCSPTTHRRSPAWKRTASASRRARRSR